MPGGEAPPTSKVGTTRPRSIGPFPSGGKPGGKPGGMCGTLGMLGMPGGNPAGGNPLGGKPLGGNPGGTSPGKGGNPGGNPAPSVDWKGIGEVDIPSERGLEFTSSQARTWSLAISRACGDPKMAKKGPPSLSGRSWIVTLAAESSKDIEPEEEEDTIDAYIGRDGGYLVNRHRNAATMTIIDIGLRLERGEDIDENDNYNSREVYYKVQNTSLEQFQSLILSSRSDQQLASLLQKRLNLQPSFIEGAVRRAVAARKIDLLKHSLEVNRLFPHDSTMRIDDEMLLQQIQKAVVRQELETLKCLLPYLATPKHYSIEGILQNLAILATHLGFPDAVKLLCSRFPICTEQTSQGYSVLLALAGYNNEEFINVMEELLGSGSVHVNTQEPNGDTALHVAIREDNEAAVGLLMANGACASIPNDKNIRPVDLALGTSHYHLLSTHSSPSPQDVSLYLAAMESDEEMIRSLIARGVSVNSKWIHGRTALSAAAINGDINIFNVLLLLGADGFPNGSVWPELPVAHALKHGHFDIAYKLVERANDQYDKMTEAEKTHIYKQLVYLLHYCAEVGASGVAIMVLNSRYSVDPSVAYLQGLSALHVACQYGHLNMVKLLLDMGMDPNIRTDIYLNSPLHYAAFYGHTHIASHLLDNYQEVSLDCENKQHETPLFCVLHGQLSAQRKGPTRESSVVFLLSRGAKLIKPGRKNCELSHFDLNYAAHRWDFIPFHTQKLIIVVRDEPRPFSLMNWCRFTIRGSITRLLNEDVTDELGLSYRMQNFILLKDWFPTN